MKSELSVVKFGSKLSRGQISIRSACLRFRENVLSLTPQSFSVSLVGALRWWNKFESGMMENIRMSCMGSEMRVWKILMSWLADS